MSPVVLSLDVPFWGDCEEPGQTGFMPRLIRVFLKIYRHTVTFSHVMARSEIVLIQLLVTAIDSNNWIQSYNFWI